MHSNKFFYISMAVSMALHGAIMIQNTDCTLWRRARKDEKIEVNYVKSSKKAAAYKRQAPASVGKPVKMPDQLYGKKNAPPAFAEIRKTEQAGGQKDDILKKPIFEKPAVMKADVISVRKKIDMPTLDLDKINNPSYLNYYQIVREKIKRAAYQNYAQAETGEVYICFIIFSEGQLGEIKLNDDKTNATSQLCDVALRSVREASPFPVFPTTLEYPQLTFNVIISFEID